MRRSNAIGVIAARCCLGIALLSCGRASGANDAAASQPTTRPREFHAAGYQSQILQDYDQRAAELIRRADDEAAGAHRDAREAEAVAYDLRRGDLLGIALGVAASDVRSLALYFLDDMPLAEQRAAIIISLPNDAIFAEPHGIRQRDEWAPFLAEYTELVRDVCTALNVALPNGVPDLRASQAREDVRRLLVQTIKPEERRGMLPSRLGLTRPGDPGVPTKQ